MYLGEDGTTLHWSESAEGAYYYVDLDAAKVSRCERVYATREHAGVFVVWPAGETTMPAQGYVAVLGRDLFTERHAAVEAVRAVLRERVQAEQKRLAALDRELLNLAGRPTTAAPADPSGKVMWRHGWPVRLPATAADLLGGD